MILSAARFLGSSLRREWFVFRTTESRRQDSGQFFRPRFALGLEDFHPFLRFGSQCHKGNPAVIAGKAVKLGGSRRKKRFRTAHISAAIMVESGGNLYQPLQEGFLRLGRAQPEFLPNLVGLEKPVRVEMREAAFKLLIFFHRAPIQFPINFLLGRR